MPLNMSALKTIAQEIIASPDLAKKQSLVVRFKENLIEKWENNQEVADILWNILGNEHVFGKQLLETYIDHSLVPALESSDMSIKEKCNIYIQDRASREFQFHLMMARLKPMNKEQLDAYYMLIMNAHSLLHLSLVKPEQNLVKKQLVALMQAESVTNPKLSETLLRYTSEKQSVSSATTASVQEGDSSLREEAGPSWKASP